MSLTKDLVERFQDLYKHKLDEAISYGEAESQLKELAELIRLTAKPEVQA